MIVFGILALVVLLCPSAAAEEHAHRIAIVKSSDWPEYNTAIEGFFEVISKHHINCETTAYSLKERIDSREQIIKEIQESKPDLILTVGSRATGMMSKHFEDIPIVFTTVLYPVASAFVSSMEKPGKNLTGAAMDIPIQRQFQTLARIIPKIKRVAVLYSPKETLPVIEEAKHVAESMNLQLLAERVNSERDVPDALNRLKKQKMDALWSVTDGRVFTAPSTRYIIEYMFQRGIPFMGPGPSDRFVRAGALVALTADYRDCGRQAAEISIQIIEGKEPKDIPVATPRTVGIALNLHVANHIGLKIPQDIIDDASQIFE